MSSPAKYQSFIIKPADRIASLQPYFFASLNQTIAAMTAKNIDLIRLDMGSPDMPPAGFIIENLVNAARQPNMHGYSPNGGPQSFRQAIASYYRRRFEVDLDPQKETLGLIGSKEGLFNLSQVLLNPGDLVLVPDPAYPVYAAAAKIAGAEVYPMPLLRQNGFLPDLKQIPEEVAQRAKLLWINYPNNPTGAVADLKFLEEVIVFARQYGIFIAHDAPYVDICFDGYKAPSILEVDGAKEIAIEFNSLSKTYNMAGWRLGMAVGNPQAISYLSTYKSQMDSSHFKPLFSAAIAAIDGDQSWIAERNKIYQHRRDTILEALRQVGFTVETPPAAIYIWAHLPPKFSDSTDFSQRLLEETAVSVTPGNVYGQFGEGYIRISFAAPTERIEEAMQRIVAWVK